MDPRIEALVRTSDEEHVVGLYVVDALTRGGERILAYAVEDPEFMGGWGFGLVWDVLDNDPRTGVAGDPVARAPRYKHDEMVACIRRGEVALRHLQQVDLESLRRIEVRTRMTRTDEIMGIEPLGRFHRA